MKKHKIFVSAVLVASMLMTAFSGCGKKVLQETYTVTYNLNYENAPERIVRIAYGNEAVDWQAGREGYRLCGWYLDAACDKPFDFNTKICDDTVLYAAWKEKQGTAVVRFDYNFLGAPAAPTVEIEKGQSLCGRKLPAGRRLGMDFTGWYRDSGCTQLWDVTADAVNDDTTLYAGYKIKDNILQYDNGGNIVYENVNVNVFVGPSFGLLDTYKALAEKFNREYAGKIAVNVTNVMIGQNNMSLRIQQTAEKNKTESMYYSIADVYSLAGLDYHPSLWFKRASREIYVNGIMSSVPLASAVPCLIYSKTLMNKYAKEGMPRNFTGLKNLLTEVYDGEKSNGLTATLVSNRGWQFKEGTSGISFIQNGAEYFSYRDGRYVCDWKTDGGRRRAGNALNNMYDLLGKEGICHGAVKDMGEYDIIQAVKNNDVFMGLINFPGDNCSLVGNTDNIGYLSLSNLFTDDDGEAAKSIPGYGLGLAFYKAGAVSMTQLTAAAVFADYLSRNSYVLATHGFYPLRRSVIESDEFVNSADKVVNVLKQTVNPEYITALAGHPNGKNVFNTLAAEGMLLPALDGKQSDIADKTDEFVYLIDGNIY